jgi:hypothetical protein
MVNLPQLTIVWSLLTIRCFPSVVSKQKIGFSVFFQRVAYCTKAAEPDGSATGNSENSDSFDVTQPSRPSRV